MKINFLSLSRFLILSALFSVSVSFAKDVVETKKRNEKWTQVNLTSYNEGSSLEIFQIMEKSGLSKMQLERAVKINGDLISSTKSFLPSPSHKSGLKTITIFDINEGESGFSLKKEGKKTILFLSRKVAAELFGDMTKAGLPLSKAAPGRSTVVGNTLSCSEHYINGVSYTCNVRLQ